MSRQWPDMFFGKVVGGVSTRRPVPAKYHPEAAGGTALLDSPPKATQPMTTPAEALFTPPLATKVPAPAAAPAAVPPTVRPAVQPGQWPGMFFSQQPPVRPTAPTALRPVSSPLTTTTTRVPLPDLPPGAQPGYLEANPGMVPPKQVSTAWPGLFFGERTAAVRVTPPEPPKPSAAPTLPTPIDIAPTLPPVRPVSVPAPTAAPLRPIPASIPSPAPGDNPLTPFLTPLAARPAGVSKISLPDRPNTEKASAIPAPAAPPVATPPPQPATVPAPRPLPVDTPAPAPVTASPIPESVVVPPAFSREAAPSIAPVFVPDEKPSLSANPPIGAASTTGATEVQREFLLNNGERISGRIVSETSETIYLHSDSLGVLTIPRVQLAQKLREIILLNGDRIIGDVIAETLDTIYIRNASLGTLTIPKAHSSHKVIEVILKNGDRVVGELITENDELILLKSATLGTISVSRKSLEMVNRRLEHHPIKPLQG